MRTTHRCKSAGVRKCDSYDSHFESTGFRLKDVLSALDGMESTNVLVNEGKIDLDFGLSQSASLGFGH
jgi:hypothetical protein